MLHIGSASIAVHPGLLYKPNLWLLTLNLAGQRRILELGPMVEPTVTLGGGAVLR